MKGSGNFSVIPKSLAKWMRDYIFDETTWVMLCAATQKVPRFKNDKWFLVAINKGYKRIVEWSKIPVTSEVLQRAAKMGSICHFLKKEHVNDKLAIAVGAGGCLENMQMILKLGDISPSFQQLTFLEGALCENKNTEIAKFVIQYVERNVHIPLMWVLIHGSKTLFQSLIDSKDIIVRNYAYVSYHYVQDPRISVEMLECLLANGALWGRFEVYDFFYMTTEKFEWLLQKGKVHVPIYAFLNYRSLHLFEIYRKYAEFDPGYVRIYDLDVKGLKHLVGHLNYWSYECACMCLRYLLYDELKPVDGHIPESFMHCLDPTMTQAACCKHLKRLLPYVSKYKIMEALRGRKRLKR